MTNEEAIARVRALLAEAAELVEARGGAVFIAYSLESDEHMHSHFTGDVETLEAMAEALPAALETAIAEEAAEPEAPLH